jgi:hypothetical protein
MTLQLSSITFIRFSFTRPFKKGLTLIKAINDFLLLIEQGTSYQEHGVITLRFLFTFHLVKWKSEKVNYETQILNFLEEEKQKKMRFKKRFWKLPSKIWRCHLRMRFQ